MANVLATSVEYLSFTWDGPTTLTQADLEALPVYVALLPDTAGREPTDGEWVAAAWINHEVAFKHGQPEGIYVVYGRIVNAATGEDVRKPCGRLRVGDPRT